MAFGRRIGLGVGFAFKAGGVLRAGFPRSVVGGDAVHGLVRAGLQGVQAGRPVAGLVLRRGCCCVRHRGFRGGGFRIRVRFRKVPVVLPSRDDRSCLGVRGLGLCRALGRPRLACGDRGLVLALDGPFHRGEAGFQLAPPLDDGSRFSFGLGLPLFCCLLRELPPLQLGPGFPGCFPPAAGADSPFLVAGVRGFELLSLGRQLAGERLGACRSGRAVPHLGVGEFLPGVGFGLRGEPQFPGEVRRGAGQGAVPVEDPGLELAVGRLVRRTAVTRRTLQAAWLAVQSYGPCKGAVCKTVAIRG
jgi:hypothetical protein